jgi:hypothetical protein
MFFYREAPGVKVVKCLPCGNRPAKGDYLTRMKQNLSNLD